MVKGKHISKGKRNIHGIVKRMPEEPGCKEHQQHRDEPGPVATQKRSHESGVKNGQKPHQCDQEMPCLIGRFDMENFIEQVGNKIKRLSVVI